MLSSCFHLIFKELLDYANNDWLKINWAAYISTILTRQIFAGYPLTWPAATWNPQEKVFYQVIELNGRYICSLCNKSYSSSNNCQKHLQIHLGKTTCTVCNLVLANRNSLLSHMERKHPQGTSQCEFCNKTFSSKPVLDEHKKKWHHAEWKKSKEKLK